MFFFFLLSLSSISSNAVQFDENAALDALHLSYAAFCNHTALEQWNCQWCNRTQGFELIEFVNSSEYGTRGYVALSTTEKRVIVSYRGSSNWQNDLEDAAAIKLVDNPFDKNDTSIKFAYGFYLAYKSVLDITQNAVKAALEKPPCANRACSVEFHGHSLGAAMAVVAAYDIATTHKARRFSLYTFGCPRVGNAALASSLKRLTGPNLRMARLHDPVPGLPLQNMIVEQFHHYSTEVYNTYATTYGEQNYTVCDGSGEDPKCYDSEKGLIKQPSEHTKYMGIAGGGCAGG